MLLKTASKLCVFNVGRLIAGVTRGLFRDVEEVEDMLVDDSSEDSENASSV